MGGNFSNVEYAALTLLLEFYCLRETWIPPGVLPDWVPGPAALRAAGSGT